MIKTTTKLFLGLGFVLLAGVTGAVVYGNGLWKATSHSTVQPPTVVPAPQQTALPPTVDPAAQSSTAFAIRGVIEGFYGQPWSQEQRLDMLSFMSEHHLNTYVYAPKDDPYQRLRWGDPYPATEASRMAALAKRANEVGVKFVYSISPGLPAPLPGQVLTAEMERAAITCSAPADRAKLAAKVEQMRGFGVHTVLLSFDDVQERLQPADQEAYGGDLARAHAELANWLLKKGRERDPQFMLWFAPTTYYGLQDNPYWQTMRTTLDPQVPVIWTGEQILSPRITVAQADAAATLLGRQPLVWDNYPVNDFTYAIKKKPELFLGPLEGRDPELGTHTAGLLSNPMLQPEASKIALATIGDYLDHPNTYRPEVAWATAVQEVVGGGAFEPLLTFAKYAVKSPVHTAGNPDFAKKVAAYQANHADVAPLRAELETLRDLPQEVHATVENQALLAEIDPWLNKLAAEGVAGLLALDLAQKGANDPAHADLRRQLDAKLRTLAGDPTTIGSEVYEFAKSIEK
ncbi:protein O-GlcNAcase [Tumebacillus permanentifrigoris]|uniref:Hyaluronoglucosaminidase n=1 Tax=Tumebacillus permanentifrigoris TaxID=378543 RepID=A0A316DGC6_9BACL|nr:protein O-GlcNAcase [Tumebacillus permanentifrigoris]PWK15623.1 hyaluronoglucosaminidase [Tumebacillus permanentifrigoris]